MIFFFFLYLLFIRPFYNARRSQSVLWPYHLQYNAQYRSSGEKRIVRRYDIVRRMVFYIAAIVEYLSPLQSQLFLVAFEDRSLETSDDDGGHLRTVLRRAPCRIVHCNITL